MAFCRDASHLTPLHKAIIMDRIEIAKFLIKNYPQTTNAMDEVYLYITILIIYFLNLSFLSLINE